MCDGDSHDVKALSCRDAWYSHDQPEGDCASQGLRGGESEKGRHGTLPGAQPRTRMWVTCDVPQRSMGTTLDRSQVPSAPNPHNSAAGRPADVSVIVVGSDTGGQGGGVQAVDALLPLLVVQLQLTLHAVVLYGRVCSSDDIKQVPHYAPCSRGLPVLAAVDIAVNLCVVVLQTTLTPRACVLVTGEFWSRSRWENTDGTWARRRVSPASRSDRTWRARSC